MFQTLIFTASNGKGEGEERNLSEEPLSLTLDGE